MLPGQTEFSKDISFKLDTGAEVTVISTKTYGAIGKPNLSKASKILYGPGRKRLPVKGPTLKFREKTIQHPVFVREESPK